MRDKIAYILLGLAILSIFQAVVIAQPVIQPPELPPPPSSYKVPPPPHIPKLEISPRHEHFQIKPGDEKEFTVKVKNKDEETVSTSPRIELQPSGEYFLEEEWLTVEPSSAEIKAGGEQEYTVTVKIPGDAEIGYYSAQVVFTNDTKHSLSLSIRVWNGVGFVFLVAAVFFIRECFRRVL